jgi:hypothetical protein
LHELKQAPIERVQCHRRILAQNLPLNRNDTAIFAARRHLTPVFLSMTLIGSVRETSLPPFEERHPQDQLKCFRMCCTAPRSL